MPAEHQIDDGAISSLLKGLAALGAMIGGLWMYLRGLSRPKCECKEDMKKIMERFDSMEQNTTARFDALEREQDRQHKDIRDLRRNQGASAAGAD